MSQVEGKTVLLRSDNTTVVHYVNKQGGTKSATLCYLLWDVMLWCQDHQVQLRAVHLAGKLNITADRLSRKRVSPLEWSLKDSIAHQVFNMLGRPHIDLFASSQNAKLPTYCCWSQDPLALAVDSLSLDWTGMFAYAFPPIPLIPKVLRKVEEEGCQVILIAPAWPKRTWYIHLLQLLCDKPLLLPIRPDLLSQMGGKVVHPDPGVFKLAAWPLSGDHTAIEAFRRRLPNCWPMQSESLPEQYTSADGRSLWAGATEKKWIPFVHL